ncbi:uncharacterized protein LOC135351363 isoform X2 [Halichondria panicea]|uniref:uncharacterized protein LOC135332188 isoform X2 n=1 Tax=Halichondria panicea TaxID=6063 RepID=UPI00312BA85B
MDVDEVFEMVTSGMTHEDISNTLKTRFPGIRGFSARSVRRFCSENGIHKPDSAQVDAVVECAVTEVGHVYGRRMLKGVLESKGIKVSEKRVSESLQRVAPLQYDQRRNDTLDRTNPLQYSALHFGHKLHIDQNEKITMFGATHIVARDGYSGKIIAYCTMPVKNNLAIYDSILRSSTKTYGLWKQIRVDHGREFYLLLYVQEALRCRVGPRDILPYVQSPSTENHTVERIWVEVNSRINYPLKRHLISMEATNLINMSDETTKFCVSFVTCNVAYHGLSLFVAAWNHHSIPDGEVPGTDEAADAYRSQGGQLREFGLFGCDPLKDRQDLIMKREQYFLSRCRFGDIFSNVVSGNGQAYSYAIAEFIRITNSLEAYL